MTAETLDVPLVITKPGVYDGIPHDRYHADPVPGGSLSASGARKLLAPYCPAIYRWEQDHPVYKDVFDFGSAAHRLVLGDLERDLVVVDAGDWRTAAARQQRDEAREAGLIPVLIGDFAVVEDMAAAIKAHPIAGRMFTAGHGKAEQSLFWQDVDTKVWRRARLDWLPNRHGGRLIIPDYKTARSADPETFGRSAMDYRYHQQASWYLEGARALDLGPDPAFVFVVQAKTPPFLVSVIELSAASLTIGRNLNRTALNRYRECVTTGQWPGHTDDVELVSLPAWYLRAHDEEPDT